MAAEAFFLFLDEKKQKIKSATMLLFAQGLCPRSGKTSGCNLFARLSLTRACASAKIYYAPCHHTARQFYLLLSEAARLTNSLPISNSATIKRAQRPVRVRGREYGL